MYVSHAAFLSSPGSNVHWNKMFALDNVERPLRLLEPRFTMAPFSHAFIYFQRKSLLQSTASERMFQDFASLRTFWVQRMLLAAG